MIISEDVNNLLKQFDMMQKMMKQMGGKGKKGIPKHMLRKLGGGFDGFPM